MFARPELMRLLGLPLKTATEETTLSKNLQWEMEKAGIDRDALVVAVKSRVKMSESGILNWFRGGKRPNDAARNALSKIFGYHPATSIFADDHIERRTEEFSEAKKPATEPPKYVAADFGEVMNSFERAADGSDQAWREAAERVNASELRLLMRMAVHWLDLRVSRSISSDRV